MPEQLGPSPRWTAMKLNAGPRRHRGEPALGAFEQRWLYDLCLAERLAPRG